MKSTLALSGVAATAAALNTSLSSSQCHVLPSDSDWPSTSTWSSFNTTVNGRLIATVPIGSPCHDPNYDEAACAALQSNWTVASTQYVFLALRLRIDRNIDHSDTMLLLATRRLRP